MNQALASSSNLEAVLAALQRDYSKLAPRIRTLIHSVTCECQGVTLRVHFPAFRQGKSTVSELVDVLVLFLTPFTLPRAQIDAVSREYGKISADDFMLKTSQLLQSAISLFIRANKATNRNGEAGELILYLLTEWLLSAPQIIAKMSLKTNREMPVHGADGVHIRVVPGSSKLLFYWGESKLYSDVGQAIAAAAKSIAEALGPEKIKHELDLVQRNIDFAGFDPSVKEQLLRYLDPFDEASNERHDITTCLIGFDFEGYGKIGASDGDAAEGKFSAAILAELAGLSAKVADALKSKGLTEHTMEIFFLPLPSVKEFRDLFQAKIGWK